MVRVSFTSRSGTMTLDENENEKNEVSASDLLDERQTDWRSMWISIFLQFVVGIQVSVYYMSMWPYLQKLDKTADVDFLGWIVASCNIGSTISNPIYGYWNQKTMSVKMPVIIGFMIAALAQTWYGLLSIFPHAKWFMLSARVLTGFGVGNIAALRIYAATASTPRDRMKAISYGTGGFVLGISFGPVFSAFFTPIGENGWKLGSVSIDMFTVVAFLMAIVCLAACVIVQCFFKENYVGIIDKNESDSNVVIPKYDLAGALTCIYLFMIVNIIATNVEVMSTPLTTVLYNWKDSQSILYNGIALCCSCIVSVTLNILLGSTRIGKLHFPETNESKCSLDLVSSSFTKCSCILGDSIQDHWIIFLMVKILMWQEVVIRVISGANGRREFHCQFI
ncbi:MFS domain-containing protein [Caenorhabditis elegans]|uniref:MFS domain-containing protein n=1 Tax=Caenorhabditis elegans TaxID=6239 RepID=Q19453_CAEEL|nr:MFS domain-containing protein [Caenorhabditis elegans]CAB01157.2 MFS domain-containing protein [Caenorhabditis elegans]|eukprot:NP_001256575.1 Uncharacterized protein CELE_F14D7.6 [Caenorhabditis elegans]